MRVNVWSCSERTVKMDTCAHAQLIGERPPRGFLGTIADDVEVHAVDSRATAVMIRSRCLCATSRPTNTNRR